MGPPSGCWIWVSICCVSLRTSAVNLPALLRFYFIIQVNYSINKLEVSFKIRLFVNQLKSKYRVRLRCSRTRWCARHWWPGAIRRDGSGCRAAQPPRQPAPRSEFHSRHEQARERPPWCGTDCLGWAAYPSAGLRYTLPLPWHDTPPAERLCQSPVSPGIALAPGPPWRLHRHKLYCCGKIQVLVY